MSPAEQASWLRYAIVQMTIRYGSSKQNAAYAERRTRDGETAARDKYLRHSRASKRQFAAIQRLSSALMTMAVSR